MLITAEYLQRERDITKVCELIANQIRKGRDFTSDDVRKELSLHWTEFNPDGTVKEVCLVNPNLISRQLTKFQDDLYITDAHIDAKTKSAWGHGRKISTWRPTELGIKRFG